MSDSTPTTPPDRSHDGSQQTHALPGAAAPMSEPAPPPFPNTASRRCPACDVDVTNGVTPSGYCRSCGHDLVSTAALPAWRRGLDLRAVARHQRHVQYVALVLLLVFFMSIMVPILAPLGTGTAGRIGSSLVSAASFAWSVISVIGGIASLWFVTRLTLAMKFHVARVVIYALLALAPCMNILVLLSASSQASAMLKLAGLKVGFFGVSDEQILRVLSSNRCTKCGYILVHGERTPRCPECGAVNPMSA